MPSILGPYFGTVLYLIMLSLYSGKFRAGSWCLGLGIKSSIFLFSWGRLSRECLHRRLWKRIDISVFST